MTIKNNIVDDIKNEIIQAIQNGVIEIDKGKEKLFEILDKYEETVEWVIEPLTDTEQTIFITAMLREEKVCEEVCADDESVDLVAVCRSIERKVKKALWRR